MSALIDDESNTVELVPNKRNAVRGCERPQTILDFLQALRADMEMNLSAEDGGQKKVSIADYLKVITAIEERQQAEGPTWKEIVVRWEDAPEEDDSLI